MTGTPSHFGRRARLFEIPPFQLLLPNSLLQLVSYQLVTDHRSNEQAPQSEFCKFIRVVGHACYALKRGRATVSKSP